MVIDRICAYLHRWVAIPSHMLPEEGHRGELRWDIDHEFGREIPWLLARELERIELKDSIFSPQPHPFAPNGIRMLVLCEWEMVRRPLFYHRGMAVPASLNLAGAAATNSHYEGHVRLIDERVLCYGGKEYVPLTFIGEPRPRFR